MANENGNAACYFVDRNAAGDNADHSAFIEADTGIAISYRDLGVETGRMAGLFQRFDIRPEERVALLSLDEIAFPVIFWGSLQAGVIPVCLNTLLSTDVYSTILKDCRARALFVSAALYPTIEPLLPDHPYIRDVFVIGGETLAGRFNFADELAASEPGGTMHVSGDDFAFWLYSSGSTGQPKGVRHVHSSLQATADTYAAQVLGIEQKDIVYSVAKLFFAYGLGNGMTFPMTVGGTAVLFAGRPTPEAVTDILERYAPGQPPLSVPVVMLVHGRPLL